MSPHAFLEISQLLLYLLLFEYHGAVCLAVVGQHLTLQVIGLVDGTLVTIQGEVVVSRQVRDIIQVASHHGQTGEP